ncbi:Receptor-like protein kinase FERONIA [Hibiscus syriacus]|uniref:Receptor-like protein kinase FERONIA n=1 Tax=Hibiscus syriacus TaxID=106335 RepID=A0A6A3C0V9_HIBSY|nr:Receptor-like protein kinase FERONIA [Hibiscus syriacus]
MQPTPCFPSPAVPLLRNFSAAQTSEALNYAFIIKEYSINVDGEFLNLTFSPSSSPNAYAFVNGIEVLSMPDIYSNLDGVLVVGQQAPFTIDNSTALENVYRPNVVFGVPASADPNVTVDYWTMPTYIAPTNVYTTARSIGPDARINENYNLTWLFSIDSGFSYLVRLHFCEFTDNVTKINQRVFDVFLNNQTAEQGADVIGMAEQVDVPIIPDKTNKPQYYDAILNGVEIFKINDPNNNLAGPNPSPGSEQETVDPSSAQPSNTGSLKNRTGIIAGGVGGGVVMLLVIGFCVFVVLRRRRHGNDTSTNDDPSGWLPLSLYGNSHSAGSANMTTTGSIAFSLLSNLCRHFSLAEIKAATNNFDDALLLGLGGFGKVYKGKIDGGMTKVGIKRGNPLSDQGVYEFQTEIEMFSKLLHRHLVSLIGYCEEKGEMIVVYDSMAYGTLREHLYKTQKPPLP